MADMMSMMTPRAPKRKTTKKKIKLDCRKSKGPPPYTALRLYTFCNFYLSSIQQGIQSAHVVSELYDVYDDDDADDALLKTWGAKHKTIIICNGGMGQDVVDGFKLLEPLAQGVYPICAFNEELAAFGAGMDDVHYPGLTVGPMTAFGLVLPDTVYEAKPCWSKISGHARKTGAWEFGVHGVNYHKWAATSIEAQIMEYVSSKPLAR